MPRRRARAHPCERLPRPALPPGRPRPLQGCSPRVRRRRRRTGAESLLRRQARHGRTHVFARWPRVAGDRLELAPRTVQALAPRSRAPIQQTICRSASLSVCGEPTRRFSQASPASATSFRFAASIQAAKRQVLLGEVTRALAFLVVPSAGLRCGFGGRRELGRGRGPGSLRGAPSAPARNIRFRSRERAQVVPGRRAGFVWGPGLP
jgi:hypothetical protein